MVKFLFVILLSHLSMAVLDPKVDIRTEDGVQIFEVRDNADRDNADIEYCCRLRNGVTLDASRMGTTQYCRHGGVFGQTLEGQVSQTYGQFLRELARLPQYAEQLKAFEDPQILEKFKNFLVGGLTINSEGIIQHNSDRDRNESVEGSKWLATYLFGADSIAYHQIDPLAGFIRDFFPGSHK
jgi:hypothetical protein